MTIKQTKVNSRLDIFGLQLNEKISNKGGIINGNIRVNGINAKELQIHDETSTDAYYLFEEGNSLFLGRRSSGTWAENSLSMDFDNMYFNRNLLPTYESKTLGSEDKEWEDLYLRGKALETNGYSRLPNGLILQWGTTDITVQPLPNTTVATRITFPIAFTKNVLTQGAVTSYNITERGDGWTSNINNSIMIEDLSKGRLESRPFQTLRVKMTFQIRWFVIGW